MLPSTEDLLPQKHLMFFRLDLAPALDLCEIHDYCRQ